MTKTYEEWKESYGYYPPKDWDEMMKIAYSAGVRSASAELAAYKADAEKVLSEQCAGDEKHCACVPVLRREIERLKAELSELDAWMKYSGEANEYVDWVSAGKPKRRDE